MYPKINFIITIRSSNRVPTWGSTDGKKDQSIEKYIRKINRIDGTLDLMFKGEWVVGDNQEVLRMFYGDLSLLRVASMTKKNLEELT